MSVIPRARAISPSAAASKAGAFSSKTTVNDSIAFFYSVNRLNSPALRGFMRKAGGMMG